MTSLASSSSLELQLLQLKNVNLWHIFILSPGTTKGGSITVQLTSSLTGLIRDSSVLQIKAKIANSHTADSKPVKQEVNGTIPCFLSSSPSLTTFLLINLLGAF